jgi:hypothetical protein
MSDRLFDEVTKSLADGIPRREAIRRLLTIIAGAVLGALGLRRGALATTTASTCNQWCNSHFTSPNDRTVCKSICLSCPSLTML